MTSKIITYNPVGISRMVNFLRARGGRLVLSPVLFGTYIAQASDSGSYAYMADGDDIPVALAGVWHRQEVSHVWLMTRDEVVPHMVSFCRQMRRNLDHELQISPSKRVRMTIVPGHLPGERLARLMGLSPRYVETGFRIWEREKDGGGNTICYSSSQCGDDDLFNERTAPLCQEGSQ